MSRDFLPAGRFITIFNYMSDTNLTHPCSPLEAFPYRVIITRWFFVAAEIGLATYMAFLFKFQLGFFFMIYAMVCGFVLLPLLRCVRCYYYGKRCNFGWGVMVGKLFSRAQGDSFYSVYGYSMLFWPLRIVPIGVGLLKILDGIMGGFEFVPQGLFGIYIIVIFLHRRFYRSRACRRCHQQAVCPVYDIAVMRSDFES